MIEIKAIAGLQFDVPRFRVAPGARVRVVLENVDDMAHNLLFVAPGARDGAPVANPLVCYTLNHLLENTPPPPPPGVNGKSNEP